MRIPATLLDLFYLRSAPDSPAELTAVVGCLQGDIGVVVGDAMQALPEDIRGQIRAAEVSRRGVFRALAVRELYITTLDAVDQEARVAGFNDALYLYGRMQACIRWDRHQARTTPLNNEGRLMVGRLDLLQAYLEGSAHAFQSLIEAETTAYHFMLPVEPTANVVQGSGIALVYPILDPLISNSIDNSFVVMRIVYDLLLRLQQDMVQEQHRHAFVTAEIPVPSRQRLEAELQADGYAIRGDVAEQQINQPHDPQANTWLQRLRALAQQWAAPQIKLPPQATPRDYLQLIADVLPAIRTSEDTAMAQALANLLEARVTPVRQPLIAQIPAQPRADRSTAPSGRRKYAPPIVSAVPPMPKQDWSRDFVRPADSPRQNPQPSTRRPAGGIPGYTGVTQKLTPDQLAWWQRSEGTTPATEMQGLTSKDDWIQDFLAEKSTGIAPAPVADTLPATDNWSDDFASSNATKQPNVPENQWSDDFEPKG
ncbi:hypothetical protein SE17_02555 [Kouleothrix aurantiaca]|uniref:Uncharacterized protein n=1 Tax=Kouleothrix aurantiaca TaxID=186479 RepID=A0A0P9DMF6_9CHLR|nr:hypothetical protein SE17_02555 [Kouleothrix aurantiaca]